VVPGELRPVERKIALDKLIARSNHMSGRLGRVLKKLREAKGWSQRELAAKANVGQAYIDQLETGARKNPTMNTIKALTKALGVPVTKLLE
jgi:transcriptional regulator with XRE-family HTH domain